MSLVIRTADPSDRAALEYLLGRLMREHQGAYPGAYPHFPRPEEAAAQIAAGYAARLDSDLRLVAVLAVDRAPVGCLVGEVVERAAGWPATVCFVEWFFVEPDARGQGIGRLLIRTGLGILHTHGVSHIELSSVPGDKQWARRGWRETVRRYVAPFEDVARWVDLEELTNGAR